MLKPQRSCKVEVAYLVMSIAWKVHVESWIEVLGRLPDDVPRHAVGRGLDGAVHVGRIVAVEPAIEGHVHRAGEGGVDDRAVR